MNNWIEPVNVIEVTKSFLDANTGDGATESLIIAIACELLDISADKLLEMIEDSYGE